MVRIKGRVMKNIWYVWIIVFVACNAPQQEPPLFNLMPADSTGIDFRNDLQHTAEFNMYTYRNFYNGGGVGMGDINNDGLVDLFFCGNMVDNKLYLNKGNFKFEDITESAGVASSNIWSTGVSFADVNGDGWLDIYVCKSGRPGGEKRHNELFINNKDLSFSEQARHFGIDDVGLSSHAAFFDYDKDGDLDLYLLNNSFRSVGGYDMRPGLREIRDSLGGNKLYRNDSDTSDIDLQRGEPIFKDVSEAAGIYGSNIGFGLGVTIGDIDRDGWQDIYVSNDFFERDYLYINQKDGTFKEDLTNQINEISMGSMGADMADINNDGLPEVFVTEMLPNTDARYKTKAIFEKWDKYQLAVDNGYHHQFGRNVLLLNNGNETFSEIGRLAGVEASDWSWSALVADFDNDGLKDIYISNGIYKDLLDQDYINFYSNDPEIIEGIKNRDTTAVLKLIDRIPSEPISNFAFRNNGDLTFSDNTVDWGLEYPSYSNGSSYGDLDNDGDLDLVINNCNMPAFVFRNNAEQHKSNHFIQISLKGTGANRFALGSQVTVKAGDELYYQELSPMRGFQSCIDLKLTLGLGDRDSIDEVSVRWPDGQISVRRNIAADQLLTFDQHAPDEIKEELQKDKKGLFQKVREFPVRYKHEENDFVDFDRDRLLFHMVSAEGPKICSGDVNNDGLVDVFIGGASGHSGSLFIQEKDGNFTLSNEQVFHVDQLSEDTDATFLDIDADNDMDLYVASGGNEFTRGHKALADRLYLNDGTGAFQKASGVFSEELFESSSCVAPADFDGDGDVDIFVGTRLLPGVYGVPVTGHLWLNDGSGNFENVTDKLAPDLNQIGMVTDASWADIDGDDNQDLILVGEWMPVTILKNNGTSLRKMENRSGLEGHHGLWNCLQVSDLDRDGDLDLVIGNHGMNTRLRASFEKPLTLYVNDFDNNRTAEQIITMFYDHQPFPLILRNDLVMQIPALKKKYLYYADYEGQTMEEIFSEESIRSAAKSTVTNTASSVAWNDGNGRFTLQQLPIQAQFAPVYAILIDDFDGDQYPDIFLGGNFYRAKPEIGIYDASYGLLLSGNQDQSFTSVRSSDSGINIEGEIRDIVSINWKNEPLILIARNNDSLLAIQKVDGGQIEPPPQ